MTNHGRLPWLAPQDLNEESHAVYMAITGGPRAAGPRLFQMTADDGRLEGPFNAMVVAPSVGGPLQELGTAIRYRTSLTDRAREVAILAVAAEARSDFEWYAHEPIALACGISARDVGAIRVGASPQDLDETEELVLRATRGLVTHRGMDADVLEECRTRIGTPGLVELVVLVGYYQTLDLMLRTFQSPLPQRVRRPFEGE